MTMQRFMNVYANLGPAESHMTALTIDGVPYSWAALYPEISTYSEFGKRALSMLIQQRLI